MQTGVARCGVLAGASFLQIFAAWGTSGIAGQEAEYEDPDEEEDYRINRDLESEHGLSVG